MRRSPAWTVETTETRQDGSLVVAVRIRGGRRIAVHVSPQERSQAGIEATIVAAVAATKPQPPKETFQHG